MKQKTIKILLLLILIISTISSLNFYSNRKSIINKELPILKEYIYDVLSLSRIDINNYSINTNFNQEYKDLSENDIWIKSMTYEYISTNKIELKFSKNITLTQNIANTIKQVHITNIKFLKENTIPLKQLESDNSDEELNKYISKLEKNKDVLVSDISTLQDKIRNEINDYINYINKYGCNLSIIDEEQLFNEYFNKEYEDLLNKQIHSKLEDIIK